MNKPLPAALSSHSLQILPVLCAFILDLRILKVDYFEFEVALLKNRPLLGLKKSHQHS